MEFYAGTADDFSTRTAHCLKFGSRDMGSNAPNVTRLELVSTKVEGHEHLAGRDDAGDA